MLDAFYNHVIWNDINPMTGSPSMFYLKLLEGREKLTIVEVSSSVRRHCLVMTWLHCQSGLWKKKQPTKSNMLEWDMVIAILQAEVGPTLPIPFTKQILYVWECTNRTTTEEPNRKPDWRARPSVQRLCYGETHFTSSLRGHLTYKAWAVLYYFIVFPIIQISNQ